MRRNEQQTATDLFNKRIGRPGPAAAYVRSAAPQPPAEPAAAPAPRYVPAAPVAAAPMSAPAPVALPAPAAATAYAAAAAARPGVAARPQATTTQEFVSRFRWDHSMVICAVYADLLAAGSSQDFVLCSRWESHQGCDARDFNDVFIVCKHLMSDVIISGCAQVWWQHCSGAFKCSGSRREDERNDGRLFGCHEELEPWFL